MNHLKFTFTILISLVFSSLAMAAPEGAITTLTVQADDINKYVQYMKKNPETFKAIGSDVAGVCVTRAGNNYPGEMFVWNAFPSLEKALGMIEAYDPANPAPAFDRLRSVKYAAVFKPLKEFDLEPGFERLWRIKLNDEMAFTNKMTELEAAIRAAGNKVNLAVFAPVGGGIHETGMHHFRAIFKSGSEAGKVLDQFYAGASFSSIWIEAQQYVDEIVSETIEVCEVIYTAK
ncbi:MAG: hypothetical protein HOA40_05240 [Porticoccaceae bacterium]|nr:hypothetical protein [Porticoccaceae bacterium]MBT6421405.1 hypothetical protein [Porticoccaceae bacterium]MBT6693664.1 hypothetical protein [Porticoccaceae bacterium]MBT6798953.1 hypothetical protein [Porticoccaceae bacterium]MBT7751636.1 hypothetical protein [Porticoccaceae bacterium]